MDAVLLEQIRAELSDLGVEAEIGADASVLTFEVTGCAGSWRCFVWAREAEGQVVVHGVLPFAIPRPARVEAALYLTRANYGLVLGNFELDLDDGEVRFKTSLDHGSGPADPALVRRLVAVNVDSVDRYLPGLLAVIEGSDAGSALRQVEAAGGT